MQHYTHWQWHQFFNPFPSTWPTVNQLRASGRHWFKTVNNTSQLRKNKKKKNPQDTFCFVFLFCGWHYAELQNEWQETSNEAVNWRTVNYYDFVAVEVGMFGKLSVFAPNIRETDSQRPSERERLFKAFY